LGVKLRQVRPVGLEYLQLVTDLLQRQRLADPFGGLYEAADMQWWYTRDPHLSDRDAVVWLSGDVPRVAAAFTRWSANRYNCVVLGDRSYAPAWAFVRARGAELGEASIEMEVDPADAVSAAEAVRAGFVASGETVDETWLDAADRARPRPVADGYVVDPMRVEQEHAGRGLAGALLREGLERLAERGCARLKVCHDVSNTTAARLYRGAGFAAHSRVSVYRRGAQAAVPG
jgi:ribosomal protein S18 acetylase RimI-like enzyme